MTIRARDSWGRQGEVKLLASNKLCYFSYGLLNLGLVSSFPLTMTSQLRTSDVTATMHVSLSIKKFVSRFLSFYSFIFVVLHFFVLAFIPVFLSVAFVFIRAARSDSLLVSIGYWDCATERWNSVPMCSQMCWVCAVLRQQLASAWRASWLGSSVTTKLDIVMWSDTNATRMNVRTTDFRRGM
jgi:hypothetical protein